MNIWALDKATEIKALLLQLRGTADTGILGFRQRKKIR